MTPAPAPDRPSVVGRRTAAILLVAACAAAWAACVALDRLPSTDEAGRQLLYVAFHRTSAWWFGASFALAAALSLVLAACFIAWASARLPARWRGAGSALSAVGWFCGAAVLAVFGYIIALGVGVEGTQTVVNGPTGAKVLITQDGFDGDNVGVYRPSGRHSYVRLPGESPVDPSNGSCTLKEQRSSALELACGKTSQVLARQELAP